MPADLTASRDALELEIERLNHEVAALKAERAEIDTRIRMLERERSDILTEVAKRVRRMEMQPQVSDHALVRFIERVHGIDLSSIKAHILTPRIVESVRAGASAVVVDGVKFIVRGGVLVTVVTNDKPKNRPPRYREVDGEFEFVDHEGDNAE